MITYFFKLSKIIIDISFDLKDWGVGIRFAKVVSFYIKLQVGPLTIIFQEDW